MDIVREDFETIWRDICYRLMNGISDRLFNEGHGVMRKDSYTTGLGPEDESLFFHDKPLISDIYKTVGISELYHLMNAAKMLQLDKSDEAALVSMKCLWGEWDKMDRIELRFQTLDWHYDYSDDPRVWAKGNSDMKEFIKDLQNYNTSEAKALLLSLWKSHVPEYTVRMPDFLKLNNSEIKQEASSHHERPSNNWIMKTKGGSDKRIQQARKQR